MTRQKIAHISFLIVFTFFCISVDLFAFDYVINDFTFYPTPNVPRPPKGITFKDSVFHTDIVRITDAPTDVPGTKYNYAQPGYPKHDIENADGSKLLIQAYSGSGWHIWNANPPYNRIAPITYAPGSSGQPIDFRWDATDPNIGYFEYQAKFWKYDVSTGVRTMLHDFNIDFPTLADGSTLSSVQMAEEGTPSVDSRYWAFMVVYFNKLHSPQWWGHAFIVYDKETDSIFSKIEETNPIFHAAGFISMSPSGKYVWIGDGHWLYTRDFSSVKKIPLSNGHADMAYSQEGREVIFGYVWNTTVKPSAYWAGMVDCETGELTYLAPIGTSRWHFSANNYDKPGWGIVSTYYATGGSGSNAGTENRWGDYEVFMVELTKRMNPAPRVWRLAKTHTCFKAYADAPFAKTNKRGTKIWFGSGWGQSYTDKGAQYDVYQINLPSTWYKDLMGNLPPTASISATPLSGKPPLTVNFTGSAKDVDGSVASYAWNFGDGSTSNQQNTSHTYETPGTYIATLKVTDDKGATVNANVTINVLKSDTTPPAPPAGLKIVK
jgi:hypothetical protein